MAFFRRLDEQVQDMFDGEDSNSIMVAPNQTQGNLNSSGLPSQSNGFSGIAQKSKPRLAGLGSKSGFNSSFRMNHLNKFDANNRVRLG